MQFSENPQLNARQLQNYSLKIRWCEAGRLKQMSYLHQDVDRGLKYALSVMFPLSSSVIDSIDKYPNLLYQSHYRTVNNRLEMEALEICRNIQDAGYPALPTPVTASVDPFHGHLSHRMAAMLSGHGWIGKSSLLVTPEYQARVRLVTLFTDLPLPTAEEPIPFNCGECRKCIEICPVNAVQEDPKAINREVCYRYLESLIKRGIVEETICGLCVKVCDGGDSA